MFDKIKPDAREKLLIWRRRANLNQQDAAELHKVTHRFWGQLERGTKTHPKINKDKEVSSLLLHEQLYLFRRRQNVRQQEVADALGCSRAWVNQMELGKSSPEQLHNFWKARVKNAKA